MTPHLIPHYGHHSTAPILAGRPMAYRGIYVPAAVLPEEPSLCDWFDPAADRPWRAAEAEATFFSPAAGGWRTKEGARDWASPAAGGWRVKKPCG